MIERVKLKKMDDRTRRATGVLDNGVQWYATAKCMGHKKWVTALLSSLGDNIGIETQTIRGAEEAVLARLKAKEKANG